MKIRLIVHFHTEFSYDSNITLSEIISQCKDYAINYVAITDHNTLKGALAYRSKLEKAGIKVILAEEVMTKSGEVIGLFIKKEIQSKDSLGKKKTLEDVISEIKRQGGLVIIPHPFDKMRNGIGRKKVKKFKTDIDALETFNSRTKLHPFNKQAHSYAMKHNFIKIVGPDAHIADELGNAIIEMEEFTTPQEFLASLKNATFYTKRLKLKNIIRPTMNKLHKKLFSRSKLSK
jgi:predicted metal-dependent phosphoesterase TrpH